MRVFIFGANGQVARSLREAAAHDKDIIMGYGARPEIDLSRPHNIEAALLSFRPDIVVNPAAFTAIDRAEIEREIAFAINRDGAGFVAAAAHKLRVPVIHLSTEYVFDGIKGSPYVETDPVSPVGVYAKSKLEGERAVAAANPRHIILRTSWVYAPFGNNFVRTVLRRAAGAGSVRVVDDQFGCPTYAPDIADSILAIARRLTDAGWNSKFSGVTNLVGPDSVSRYEFARAIMEQAAVRGGPHVQVDAIATADYPTPVKRLANSRLSTKKLFDIFEIRLPPMQQSLAHCMDRLLAEI